MEVSSPPLQHLLRRRRVSPGPGDRHLLLKHLDRQIPFQGGNRPAKLSPDLFLDRGAPSIVLEPETFLPDRSA